MANSKINFTISRTGLIEEDEIEIEVSDEKSGIMILKLTSSLDEFMRALTGVGHRKFDLKYILNSNNLDKIGKKKISQTVFCDKTTGYYDNYLEKQKEIVNKDFDSRFKNNEWEIWDYGTRSIQNNKYHSYIICKYVDIPDDLHEEEDY